MPRTKNGRFTKKSTAQKIRDRAAKGQTRVEIAKALNVRYQMVRNVLTRGQDEAEVETAEAVA